MYQQHSGSCALPHAGMGQRGTRGSVAALILVLCAAVPPAQAQVAGTASPPALYLQWLRVAAAHPRMLFAGGRVGCPGGAEYPNFGPAEGPRICQHVLLRSTDGGTSWADLTQGLHAFDYYLNTPGGNWYRFLTFPPPTVTPDGQSLFTEVTTSGPTPSSDNSYAQMSSDFGTHWQDIAVGGNSVNNGASGLVFSPASPRRLYVVLDTGSYLSAGDRVLYRSDDGGQTWRALGAAPTSLVPDPARADTVYANGAAVGPVARSDDGGMHWTVITAPPGVARFTVFTDPYEGTALVARTADPGVPADRRYLSHDGGHTWVTATCPGDRAGVCPRLLAANILGPGVYALFDDGIYRVQDGGPAGQRMATDRLPLSPRAVLAVAGGTGAGDPVYLLGQGLPGGAGSQLYRSTNAGQSWQTLPVGPLPADAPASHAPGTLYARASNHSVAAPFVSLARTLGPDILGPPLTEPYRNGATLTQDFAHLQLEQRAGHVVVGNLGTLLMPYRSLDWSAQGAQRPAPNTPTRRYFPQTGHLLQGDMLRFWLTHGGMAVLGAPISQIIKEVNSDGSGRVYEMQWFENARLERHPELHNPRYAILLGLLGHELLHLRGWR